mmetsp:Transcript_12640/g.44738  ORF Transcript_12640/g.44738 Transcript_12640/m.44738 type:complete len:201 (-) Transcript_12640:144-746(-)
MSMLPRQIAAVPPDALGGMLAEASVAVWKLRYTKSAQAIPTKLAVQVLSITVSIPTRLVGPQPFAKAIHALLEAVQAHGLVVGSIAALARPQRAPADAQMAGRQLAASALSVEVARRSQWQGHIGLLLAPTLAGRLGAAHRAMGPRRSCATAKGLLATGVGVAQDLVARLPRGVHRQTVSDRALQGCCRRRRGHRLGGDT